MPRLGALVTALVLLAANATAGVPSRLPPLAFEDQAGRQMTLASLQGAVAVIVYGGRDAMDQAILWGQRLEADLRARGAHTPDTPETARPVRILALAQMGGIPRPFRGLLRGALRERTPAGFSLWLDWTDELGAHFGAHPKLPTVVVADRSGTVRLVMRGAPEPAAWHAVANLVHQLHAPE